MDLKQYYSRENTPLKFHTFMRYIGLPLGILGNFSSFVRIWVLYGWDGPFAFDLIFIIASLILSIVTFVGFFSWKPYSWYTLMSGYGLSLFYYFLALLLYASYNYEVRSIAGRLIGMLFWSTIVGIYYYKRKPLFIPQQEAPSAPFQTPSASVQNNQPPTRVNPSPMSFPQTQTKISFCRQCGAQIIEGSSFCNKCGSRLDWN